MRTLVFIPTYNEVGNIGLLLEEISDTTHKFDILVIDDSSSDGTYDEAKNTKLENLTIIVRKNKTGIGSAHRDAIQYAVSNRYTNLVTMDGDGTHRPADLFRLIEAAQRSTEDIIIGSRFIKRNSINDWPKSRIILTYLGHLVTKFGLGLKFDCSSGFRAYKINEHLLRITESLEANQYDFFFKSIFKFNQAKLKIAEIDIVLEPRGAGNSKMTVKNAIYSVTELFITVLKFRLYNSLNTVQNHRNLKN
jgi:dolichol-phosphate mannosyltransferase